MVDRSGQLSWREPLEEQVREACIAACNGDALLAAILARRGLIDADRIRAFLAPDLYNPAAPEQLPDLARASAAIQEAIAAGKRLLIWGDFDVDGQTSTALLLDALTRLDANVSYYIPQRGGESHGIKPDSLQRQVEEKRPDLLITCDTGISEFAAFDYTNAIGLPVIVTDHHDMADHLPEVMAVINPRRLPQHHPLTSLPGVGVAYKLMQHLYTSLGRERELSHLLDLVALGIIGDVAMQTDDTRYLLQLGLERLRRADRIGLKALLESANLSPAGLTGERIAYQVAPRLNAAGRLADAALSVELLTTHNMARARILAQQLEGLNEARRLQTRQIELAAEAMIAADPALLESAALVLYRADWNPGIVGIVAAHLAERYGKPVVMLAGEEAGIARGSARATSGYDLAHVLTAQADILRTFGGHPGAAGLSLETQHIERLRQRLSERFAQPGLVPDRQLVIDAFVDFEQVTLDLAHRLERLSPYGEGNRAPVLATRRVHLAHAAIVGRDSAHRRLTVEDSQGNQQVVMWWRSASENLPDGLFDMAFNVSINERQELQVTLEGYRPIIEAPVAVVSPLQIVDWRDERDPYIRLARLLGQTPDGDAQVWAEGFSRQEHPDWRRRAELQPGSTLIIYSMPPDPSSLQEAIRRVQPQVVYVCAVASPIASLDSFLVQLIRATQNVITQHQGATQLNVLCGATAQSSQTVRAGLDFLVTRGDLGSVTISRRGRVQLTPGKANTTNSENLNGSTRPLAEARLKLEKAFRESEAFRRYFRTAPLDGLLTR